MRKTVGRIVIVGAIVAVMIGGTARASGDVPRVTFTRMWGHGPVATVIVRNGCIDTEDSAGHLRLRRYGDGVAVYGCHRRGY